MKSRTTVNIILAVFITAFGLEHAPTHAVSGNLFDSSDARLFKTTVKNLREHQFIIGPIDYHIDENADKEGYLPTQTLVSKGKYRERVYDYSGHNTALEIASRIAQQLETSGYALDFQCEKEQCGDVQAWQLFMSPFVDGEPGSQYYLFAQKPLKEALVHQLAVYVNEFSGVPRTVVHEITAASPQPLLEIEEHGVVGVLEQLQFDFDSARLAAAEKKKLRALVASLEGSSDAVLIVGHADERGTDEYNDVLSRSRAESVQRFLIQAGLDRSRIFLRGDGERFASANDADTPKRRVDIFKVARGN